MSVKHTSTQILLTMKRNSFHGERSLSVAFFFLFKRGQAANINNKQMHTPCRASAASPATCTALATPPLSC